METGGLLYAIRAEGTSLVKIGYTRGSVEKRVKTLQTGQPFPLRVIATQTVDHDVRQKEAWLHAFLKQERRRGEWFEMALEPEAFVALIARAIEFGAAQEAERQAAKAQKALRRQQARLAHVASPPKKKRPRIVDLTQLGQRVREGRKARELSQIDLAALLGSAQGWLSEVESGDHASMEVDTVRRLAETLGVSTDYLLGLTDDPTPPRRRRARREVPHA